MKALIETAAQLQAFLEANKLRFCFIGGLAVQNWSEARLTRDVDLTILAGFKDEERIIDLLLQNYQGRLPNTRTFALENRVLLLRAKSGITLDVSLGGLPFEEKLVERAQLIDFGNNIRLRLCSAEDLLVMKVFAGRPEDWRDVEGILIRQRDKLDMGYVFEQLEPLLEVKEDTVSMQRLRDLL